MSKFLFFCTEYTGLFLELLRCRGMNVKKHFRLMFYPEAMVQESYEMRKISLIVKYDTYFNKRIQQRVTATASRMSSW